jgi:signal transduction histidine kinase
MVWRYLEELKRARAEVDRVNAGLEDMVKARTSALIRANEEVQRFAYIVSHDLRSPLVNVMGYTAELEQAGKTIDLQMTKVETLAPGLVEQDALTAARDDIPEAVGFIRASTEKMDRLINAILKLSREGRRSLAPETLDVGIMAERIADSIRHQIEAGGSEFVVCEIVPFESDRLSIEQIFGNLIDNAVKYLDPQRPGRIKVSGRDLPGGWVEYDITDNGRGIAAKDHERIFELFRRAGRQDRQGEGLGLAFVRNSVRRLGGTIEVESVLGKGSIFRLKFPKRLILDETGDTV